MELSHWLTLLCSALLLASLLLRRKLQNGAFNKPPGPRGWPVVGNMFDLGALPYQTFYKLRFKYGPVLWLKLGSTNTIVVQTAKSAAELFKNHDQCFADRLSLLMFTANDYHLGSIAFGRYGPYWRAARRVVNTELLLSKHVANSASIRQKCVDDMVRFITEDSAAAIAGGESGAVELGRYMFAMLFNVIGNMTMSKDLADYRSGKGFEFFEAMNRSFEWAGTPSAAEYLPWLRWLDSQGLMKKMRRDLGVAMSIVEGFVKERVDENKRSNKGKNVDLLDALLNYDGDGKQGSLTFSDHQLIIIILEIFFAGTETTSGSLEWIIGELLKNPDAMKKTKEELDRVIGRKEKVSESDMNQLPYLQAVLKEAMRLHPAVPLLVPRYTMEDTNNFMGYFVPKGTQVFVNVWAIGRDPDAWDDPLSFKPERFMSSNIEFKGTNYELIPFGSGRRMCVGYALAHKIMQLTMASLLHYFDWELESGVLPETLNMNERLGFTVRKDVSIKVIPKKRSN